MARQPAAQQRLMGLLSIFTVTKIYHHLIDDVPMQLFILAPIMDYVGSTRECVLNLIKR